MGKSPFVLLGVLVLSAGTSFAQEPIPVTNPSAVGMCSSCGDCDLCDCCRDECHGNAQFYGGIDFLIWWVKSGPSHFPLVTVGSDADEVPAALGQPGTHVLFGGDNFDFGRTL